MDYPEIAKLRIANQQLAGTGIKTASEMVRWLGAVQGQEYAQTKWGLGLRLPHLKDPDIERELNEGKILRTHLLRPTWHFVAAEDIRRILQLSAPRVHQANGFMYRKLELDTSVFNRCNDIIIKALQQESNKQLTRDAFHLEFKKHKIVANGHRLSYIMMQAELEGIVCSGARQGKQHTYALLDDRVPVSTPTTKEDALAEFTKRYFMSRGPATIRDFSTWSGFTIGDCKRGLESAKKYFAEEQINGKTFYFSTEITAKTDPFREVLPLPVYDELLMGYKESRDVFLQFANSLEPKTPFRFDSTILYENQIIGTWKRNIRAKSIDFEYDFFRPPSQQIWNCFNTAIDRFGRFEEKEIVFPDR